MERLSQVTALHIFGASHEGMSGKHNEDSYGFFAWRLEDKQVLHLGVVADGVGGQIAGEIASRVTVDTVGDYFDRQESVNNISGHLEQAILAANEAVYNASQENPDYRGMSTTIAMAAVVENRLYTAHVGDSRLYFLRNGRLRQISTDHTWAQEAIEAGLLTREQARSHPNRNVIKRHLGGKLQVEVDHRLVLEGGQTAEEAHTNQGMTLQPGDIILICSDGLTDMITDEAVFESLKNHFHDLGTAASELVDKANEAGGRDNITVVIMQIPIKEGVPVATTIIERKPAVAVHEPTLITAAPKTAAVAAATAAPATRPATTNGPAVAMPVEQKRRNWKLPLLFIGGGGLLLLLVLGAGALFLFTNGNGDPTATVTVAPVVDPVTPSPSNTPGSPATAAFLETSSEPDNVEPTPAGTSDEVPTLRPTLTPSSTPTRTPVPPPPLSTSTPSILATLTAAAGSSPPPPPSATPQQPTDEPLPPTPVPPTPVPPTSTPSVGTE